MRKILIVGAGQSGLLLAHLLLTDGYDVTVVTGSSSTDLRTKSPRIMQFTLGRALAVERSHGLDYWSNLAPALDLMHTTLYTPQGALEVNGRLSAPGMAVDARIKLADWLERFEDRGGKVSVTGVTTGDLEYFSSRMFDLVVVAVGDGELGKLFQPDRTRFPHTEPRVVTQAFVHGLDSDNDGAEPSPIEVHSAPQGRLIIMPMLAAKTSDHWAHAVYVMDRPGGAMDSRVAHEALPPVGHRPQADQVTDWILRAAQAHMPALAPRLAGIQPVDSTASLVTEVTPYVRNSVAELDQGGKVLATADVAMYTDPIGGQGWNLSTVCAQIYRKCIVERGDAPFTGEWMHATFEKYWQAQGRDSAMVAHWLATLWDAEMPPHLQEVLGHAVHHPYGAVASRFSEGIDDPTDYHRWLLDETAAREFLAQAAMH